MEVVFGICTATAWRDSADSVVGPAVFGSIIAALGVIGLGSFGSLFCFHVYLLGKGYGTIDFIMERAMLYDQQQKARFQEAAAAQQSQRTLAQAGAQQAAAGAAAAASVPAPQQQLEIVVAPAWAAQALAAADASAAGAGLGLAAATAGPPAGLLAPAPDQATASMVQLAEPAAASHVAAAAAAPGPGVEAAAAVAPAAHLPAPVAQAALTSHCISQEEQDEIAAEIEAGRRAIEASRARFRAGNPADSGSLFQAAQAVESGGYGVVGAGAGVSGAMPSSNTAGSAMYAAGSGIAPAAAHSNVAVVPSGAADPDAPVQLPGAMPPSARAPPAAELSSHGYGLSATKQWLGLIAQESADTRSAGDASAAGSPAPTVASVGSSSSAQGATLSPDSYQLLSATGSATHSLAPDALQTGTGHDAGSPAGIIVDAPLQPSAATAVEAGASDSAP